MSHRELRSAAEKVIEGWDKGRLTMENLDAAIDLLRAAVDADKSDEEMEAMADEEVFAPNDPFDDEEDTGEDIEDDNPTPAA